ncbi:MAG TPA: aminomethyl-transferring glycine dehydrogenase [Planctomycetota bacterium]|nr:aminomethyl-transferring glycine dehydrogenase [Planctomycetota bacterium]
MSLDHPDQFVNRHIGPDDKDVQAMLKTLGVASLDELIAQTVPESIRFRKPLNLPPALTETEMLAELSGIAAKNQVFKSYIGMGYSDCITPPVILRNIVQNPGWYTQYTPYQAEIAQGRLEALLNFQTMIAELTGMEIANASLLDEGTAAAEAMHMFAGLDDANTHAFFVASDCYPQTIDIVKTRAEANGVKIIVADHRTFDFKEKVFGALIQYPAGDGAIHNYRSFVEKAHASGAKVVVAADLLSLAVLTPPGEWGADVVVGNSQRFGVPLGYGGPHAAFFATKNEHTRRMPGRIIGVSKDSRGQPALRMAIQTREQHIRREKATSNICTAQVLLAVVASMYGVYHGADGLRKIAARVQALTKGLAAGLKRLGTKVRHSEVFDTIIVEGAESQIAAWHSAAVARKMNFRVCDAKSLGISLDECTSSNDVQQILSVFSGTKKLDATIADLAREGGETAPQFKRKSVFMAHPVFNTHHSETEMLRYIKTLESRDLSLTHSMIALGSCTMKLNATAEMIPITWPQFNAIHPFAPTQQTAGYQEIFKQLESWLAEITGFAATSLQPNAGSQGEYAGLLVIRKYHQSRGEGHRDVCLIPSSAHGTNPASAVMAGFKVVVVKTDAQGNVDVADLKIRVQEHSKNLAALMVTYPSTHGVFEEEIKSVCALVHEHGGQVYMDGANMNAQVGLCRPGDIGADVCHINLHKTFCIPHGGGGPGMGPISVAAHLAPFLPTHPVVACGGTDGIGAISAAPWGSASILLISWAYIRMMGGDGLTKATKIAILNANYVARRLESSFPVFYKGKQGRVAHECILDMRHLKGIAGIEVDDIAKRLMDYGFHSPTMSFPIPSTMMIEPTESESKAELDRFCEAMIAIRNEIKEVESGAQPRENNVLKNAPHTADVLLATEWTRPYAREKAAYPVEWLKSHKFWPSVGRLDNVYGDRNLVCACTPIEEYAK